MTFFYIQVMGNNLTSRCNYSKELLRFVKSEIDSKHFNINLANGCYSISKFMS